MDIYRDNDFWGYFTAYEIVESELKWIRLRIKLRQFTQYLLGTIWLYDAYF